MGRDQTRQQQRAVPKHTYLPAVGDVQVISYRGVLCRQRIDLQGRRRTGAVTHPVQNSSYVLFPSAPPPTFSYFWLTIFPAVSPLKVTLTAMCWQHSKCLPCPQALQFSQQKALTSLSKLQTWCCTCLVKHLHSPDVFSSHPFLSLPSSFSGEFGSINYKDLHSSRSFVFFS